MDKTRYPCRYKEPQDGSTHQSLLGHTVLYPHPWKSDVSVNAQAHKPNLRGRTVFLEGTSIPAELACTPKQHPHASAPTSISPQLQRLTCRQQELTLPASMGQQPPGSCSHGSRSRQPLRNVQSRTFSRQAGCRGKAIQPDQSDSSAPPTRCY